MAYVPNARTTKPGLRAPCIFMYYDERRKRTVDAYPAVSCTYQCETCGFNPEVAARRLEKMKNGMH